MSIWLILGLSLIVAFVLCMAFTIHTDGGPWPMVLLIPTIPLLLVGITDNDRRTQIKHDLTQQGFDVYGVDGIHEEAVIIVDGRKYNCYVRTNDKWEYIIRSPVDCTDINKAKIIDGGIKPGDMKEEG